jgi:hypothetical protein
MNKKFLVFTIMLVVLISLIGCVQLSNPYTHTCGPEVTLKIIGEDNSLLFDGNQACFEETNAFEAVKIMLDNNLEYTEYDFGVFITSILGVTPKENEFWSLYINGEKAAMGISSYNISENILIEFKLEELQTFE